MDTEMSTGSEDKIGRALTIVLPKRHIAKIVVWTDLSVTAIDRLNESTNPEYVKQVLADIFMLDQYRTHHKVAIIMDLFYNTLHFAKMEHFSPEKTSAFFSIMKSIFEMCIETPFGNQHYTYKYFQDLVLCHSLNRPPYSIVIFTAEDVVKISQNTMNTFFRHFEMYKYAFTSQIELDLTLNYVGMPPSPSPSEVTPDDIGTNDKDEIIDTESNRPKTIDSEQLSWIDKETLKKEVTELMSEESRKYDDIIHHHIHAAADVLYLKLAQMVTPKSKVALENNEQDARLFSPA